MKTNRILLMLLGLVPFLISGCSDEPDLIEKPSAGATLDVEVGGSTQPNQVYVDLSRDGQSSVQRNSWDLGFYNGSDFRVKLNASVEMLAYELDKSDLTAVTAEDTVGLGSKLSIDAIFASLLVPPAPDWVVQSINWADDPSGDLSGTAIDAISDNSSDNNVYIINRGVNPDGSERGWLKVKVDRSGNGYSVEYADINNSTISSAEIAKGDQTQFTYFSFDSGEVTVTPPTTDWDIAFTTYIDILNFGVDFPYKVRDWVIQNRESRTAIFVIDEGADLLESFNSFTSADIAGLTFAEEVDAIGGDWRTVASPTPGSVTAVKSDRFYVIEDPAGNYYKLIFTGMLSSTGERGFPQIQYEIVE